MRPDFQLDIAAMTFPILRFRQVEQRERLSRLQDGALRLQIWALRRQTHFSRHRIRIDHLSDRVPEQSALPHVDGLVLPWLFPLRHK